MAISPQCETDKDTQFWLKRELDLMEKLAAVLLEVPLESRDRVLEWFRRWSDAEWGLLATLERAHQEAGENGGG